MNYIDICKEVEKVAVEAGKFIARQRLDFDLGKVEHKGKFDLVSYVDKEAEKLIVSRLCKIVPEAGFITEEGTTQQCSQTDQLCWVIDPLDGTTNFVHGFSPYCVSIALVEKGIPVVGVVYEITKDECFAASIDSNATMNGSVITVSIIDTFEDSLIVGGFAHKLDGDQYKMSLDTFEMFNRTTHGVRRTGSAATNLVDVAAGRAEMFYQVGLSSWDVAAGALIVQRAGGKVGDFGGGSDFVFGRQIVASNGVLFDHFLNSLRAYV